jgi:hypothetical protein
MESNEFYDILGPNFESQERIFTNEDLIRKIFEKVDTSHFDLKILNSVFTTFLENDKKVIKKIQKKDFEHIKVDSKKYFKTSFVFDQRTWIGTVIKEKWINGKDQNEWFTYSIKLPNDGYFYTRGNSEVKSKPSDKYFIELLKKEHYNALKDKKG